MKLENEVVLITGANRGLGLAFAREALARGAKKVYAAARNPESVTLPGVVPVKLDVTRAQLETILALVPDAWLDGEPGFASAADVRAAYLRFFETRLAHRALFEQEAVRARAQLV